MSSDKFEIKKLTKYCNETLILSLLERGDKHGYQISLEIEELSDSFFKFNHGTLYPILHKLEADKFIEGVWPEDEGGRKRKFYSITKKGREYLTTQKVGWKRFSDHLNQIMGE